MKEPQNHHEQVRTEIRDLLKKNKLRVTASRMAVMMIMHERKAPMTHQELIDTMPIGSYDKASIWRVLSNLSEVGLLVRMDLGDRVWRYELIDSCRSIADRHAHFLCEGCGMVCCLPPLSLTLQEALPKELEGVDLQIRVTGRCNSCFQAR